MMHDDLKLNEDISKTSEVISPTAGAPKEQNKIVFNEN